MALLTVSASLIPQLMRLDCRLRSIQTFLCSRPSVESIHVLVQSFDLHVWPHSFVFTNSTSGPHVSTQSKSSHINLNLFNDIRASPWF